MFARGARLLLSRTREKGAAADILQGTQHLLTAAGRKHLVGGFKCDFESGAEAIITALDTSYDHLDAANMFEDYDRDNDLSWYVIGKGNGEGGYELQNNGYTQFFPRASGLSVGEKRNLADMFAKMTSLAALEAREEARASSLLGATIQFSAQEDGTHLADGSLHLGNRMETQIKSAALAEPDFFAITGCATAHDVELVAAILSKNRLREEKKYFVDTRGFDIPEETPSSVGFEIPALLVVSSAEGANGGGVQALAELAEAAAASELLIGIACLDAPMGDADLDAIHTKMRSGSVLAGRSADEATDEMVVLRV